MNTNNTNYVTADEARNCDGCEYDPALAGRAFANGDVATGEIVYEDGRRYYLALDRANGDAVYETEEVPH